MAASLTKNWQGNAIPQKNHPFSGRILVSTILYVCVGTCAIALINVSTIEPHYNRWEVFWKEARTVCLVLLMQSRCCVEELQKSQRAPPTNNFVS